VTLPSSVSYTYDGNGNLVSDGNRCFAYNDENQLASVWVTNVWRTDFAYDGRMRLRQRTEWAWSGSGWNTISTVRYVYDGNVVVQEQDQNNASKVSYTRGRDLSGTMQGAGGIGGLLARSDNSAGTYACYFADGNGNITCMTDTNQAVVAGYLYDPYGRILSQSGPLAAANLYRFSSKEFHVNSGLVYYLYRFYDPSLQRWINRDSLAEPGFEALHLVTQPLLIRKLRLGINDPQVRFLLAMAMRTGSVDVRGYFRNSHTPYSAATISASQLFNLLRSGRGDYAPNWPPELLEAASLFDFAGNDPLDGIDPFGLWNWYNPASWPIWGSIENSLEALWIGIEHGFRS
jgi:RHS repeat-associated protein